MRPKYHVGDHPCWQQRFFFCSLIFSASAQQVNSELQWEKVAPAHEEFTAQMPGTPEVTTRKSLTGSSP